MTADNAAEAPNIATIIPVFGIGSYDEAVAHYVDWLGFNLDWEWRSAPGRPVIMAISRPGVGLMLNEANTSAVGSSLVLHVAISRPSPPNGTHAARSRLLSTCSPRTTSRASA